MTDQHPITPPPELVKEWRDLPEYLTTKLQGIATQAARWGADQELEACCEWVKGHWLDADLRSARRPKPPSLKERALEQLDSLHSDLKLHGLGTNTDTIRSALKALPDD